MYKLLRKKLRIEKHYRLNRNKQRGNIRFNQQMKAAKLMGENTKLTWKRIVGRFKK